MTTFSAPITDTTIEQPSANLPADRKSIVKSVRARSNRLPEYIRDTIFKMAEREALNNLLSKYEKFIYQRSTSDFAYDFFEFAAGVADGADPNSEQANYIDWLSTSVTRHVPFQAQTCGFANQTDSRRDIYNKYPEISDVCRYLKCPIIEANETDYLVLTTINPYTANLAAETIGEILFRETNMMPFIFLTVCPVRTRNYLCSKHFVYES